MSKTIRLTMAQALTRFLARQMTEIDGETAAALRRRLGDLRPRQRRRHRRGALSSVATSCRPSAPTTSRRWRMPRSPMPRRTSAAGSWPRPPRSALARSTWSRPRHWPMSTVCRCCLLPGDVFANRIPDPVLQQVEDFGDGTVSANDCFRPVSRYFDRITRPEQIIPALQPRHAGADRPGRCGPVTLALCQDVQAEAYDYPESFFEPRVWTQRRPRPGPGRAEASRRCAEKGQEAADHRRRRRALFRRLRPAREICRGDRHSGLRDARRQVLAAGRQSAQHGGGRRHRHVGRQPSGRGGRCRAGGRHAAAGFHHRLVGAVQEWRARLSSG